MKPFGLTLFLLLLITSCKKKEETVVFTNNTIPAYDEVPSLLVENYINRIYIDLIGREPSDAEMSSDLSMLEAAELAPSARRSIINKLMTSTLSSAGDSSYTQAYYQKYYDDNKARFLEAATEGELWEMYYLYYFNSVQDSTLGNTLAYEVNRTTANNMRAVLDSKYQLRMGQIDVGEMCRRMCYNALYDNLHMNTFNFINATFDDLFFRYPTDAELDEAFEPVEQVPSADDPDLTGYLFGQVFSNKEEYLNVLIASDEYAEGMIRWVYQSLLGREPGSAEVYAMLPVFNNSNDIREIQTLILVSDEYAGFE